MDNDLLDLRTSVIDLSAYSTEELREALAQTLEISALHIVRMAMIWRELEGRGVDLSDLRSGLFTYLPQIAAGRLDAGLVVRLAGKPALLGRIAQLPLEDQRALLERGAVPISRAAADGSTYVEDVPIEALSAAQVNKAFVGGRLRAPSEQGGKKDAGRIEARAEWLAGGVIKIGRQRVRLGDLLAAMPQHPTNVSTDGRHAVPFHLGEEQFRRVKARAALAGLTTQDYIARTLALTGAFEDV